MGTNEDTFGGESAALACERVRGDACVPSLLDAASRGDAAVADDARSGDAACAAALAGADRVDRRSGDDTVASATAVASFRATLAGDDGSSDLRPAISGGGAA